MIFNYVHYRDYLRDLHFLKQQKNPSYSLRSFAASLETPVSSLSNVIAGKRALTNEAAERIIEKLKLNSKEARYFRLLVQRQNSPEGSDECISLQRQIDSVRALELRTPVGSDELSILTKSWMFALIELAGIAEFRLTSASAARALVLTEEQADILLANLVKAGRIRLDEEGSYRKVGTGVIAASETINLNLRQFHMEMMEQGKRSLIEQSPAERFIGSETFSFDSAQIAEANEIFEECFTKIVNLANRGKSKDSVYHVGIQMFRLTQAGSVKC